MGNFLTEILRKYGTPAIVFAIVVAVVVWGLAHWVSQSGKEVSVLWGFVKYTKGISETTAGTVKRVTSEPTVMSKGQSGINQGEASPTIDLQIKHGISKGNISKILKDLRTERNLRELTAIESGKNVEDLPKGTYFFFLCAWVDNSSPVMKKTILSQMYGLSADRYKGHSQLEIHKINNDEVHAIFYVNEIHASEIEKLSGVDVHRVIASPYPWGQMTSLVSIPVSRIQTSKHRYVQATSTDDRASVLDLTVR